MNRKMLSAILVLALVMMLMSTAAFAGLFGKSQLEKDKDTARNLFNELINVSNWSSFTWKDVASKGTQLVTVLVRIFNYYSYGGVSTPASSTTSR